MSRLQSSGTRPSTAPGSSRLCSGFTLVEVMVVVCIIGLLISIIIPSIGATRRRAKLVACSAQLKQVGIAMMAYLQDSGDRMPHVSFMPSISPAPLTTAEPVSIVKVLERHVKGQVEVFRCPEDLPGKTDRPAPNTGLSFFQSERSSYCYRGWLAGRTPQEFNNHPMLEGQAPHTIWVMRDYDNFHNRGGKPGARRYLYIDGHVADYEN